MFEQRDDLAIPAMIDRRRGMRVVLSRCGCRHRTVPRRIGRRRGGSIDCKELIVRVIFLIPPLHGLELVREEGLARLDKTPVAGSRVKGEGGVTLIE